MISLSIIIVSYNTKNLLRECLLSIEKYQPQNLAYEIIIVDNGSTDGSVEEIENLKMKNLSAFWRSGNLKMIVNKENFGFARANNQGIKSAKGEFVLLLNSDAEVMENTLEEMVRFMKGKKEIGVVGCKIMNFDKTPQASIGRFLNLKETIIWLLGGERLGLLRESPDTTVETDWVSGAAFLTRRELFDKVGLLDEKFFMYLEEMEWCYRIKKANFSVWFYPQALIFHKSLGSGNREKAILNIYQGLLHFYKKHKNPFEFLIIWLLLKLKAGVLMITGFIFGNAYLKNTYEKAFKIS